MQVDTAQIKKFLSAMLVIWGRLYRTRLIPVLVYHSVDDSGSVISISPGDFKGHMRYLKDNGYRSISLIEYVGYLRKGWKPRDKLVVITFDDGFMNNYTEAFPVLRMHGFTATIFITTDYVGKTCAWMKDDSIPGLPMMSWSEIREMRASGIDFEAHTCSHPHLTELSVKDIRDELVKSKSILEDKIDREIDFFGHPYGDTDCRSQQVARECGYKAAFGYTGFRLNDSQTNLYDLKRLGTAHFRSVWDLRAGLLGTYHWYIKIKKYLGI